MNRLSLCLVCKGSTKWHGIGDRQLPSRLLSTATNAAAAVEASSSSSSHNISYDRDTGVVWETTQTNTKRTRPLYQTIIGIEIHAQLSIPTKLFSSAPTRHAHNTNTHETKATSANTSVHPYDLAYPGTLPSLSLPAVKASILTAAALNCEIHKTSRFERKHYFYPDLPQGYQITQQRWPLASDGTVTFDPYFNRQIVSTPNNKNNNGKKKGRRRGGGGGQQANDEEAALDEVTESSDNAQNTEFQFEPKPVQLRIERIQMEQDTGKTTTHEITTTGQTVTKSHIDYNRAGCALVEIVSHPDLRSAHEAAGVVEKIRKLLKHVGSCDGKMEEGSLRCDLNVSIAPIIMSSTTDEPNTLRDSREELPSDTGHRVEVKNLNSLRQIIVAAEYEALRQSSLAQRDEPTGRETRTFNVKPISDSYPLGGETICIRAKGDAVDYRFMPEPDLPPLILDEETLDLGSDNVSSLEEFVEQCMPESPEEARARLVNEYGLTEDVADVITGDPPAIALFELTAETARTELSSMANGDATASSVKPGLVSTLAANWLCNDLFALVKKNAENDVEGSLNNTISVENSTVDGERLGALVAMVANGELTTSMAKKVLAIMFVEDLHSTPRDIAATNGWQVISDPKTLIELCKSVVYDSKNASQLEQYKAGGKKIWKIEKFWVGRIMKASKGNADPERMKEALAVVLEEVSSSQ